MSTGSPAAAPHALARQTCTAACTQILCLVLLLTAFVFCLAGMGLTGKVVLDKGWNTIDDLSDYMSEVADTLEGLVLSVGDINPIVDK